MVPGHCVGTSYWVVGFAAVSTILGVYIMLLLPILWNLLMWRKPKMMLTGFFFYAYW